MRTSLKLAALSLALPGAMAVSIPAAAAHGPTHSTSVSGYDTRADTWNDRNDRYRERNYNRNYGRSYDEPVYQDTRTWRGNDGRYYCKKKNGTTGLIIGGAAGARLGREIAGRGDNTLGTILGAGAGALLGREVARSGSRKCR